MGSPNLRPRIDLAAGSWTKVKREQYCQVSSPKNGWGGGDPKPHADFFALKDFPTCWGDRGMAVDVEAKAKELVVARLMEELGAGTCNETNLTCCNKKESLQKAESFYILG